MHAHGRAACVMHMYFICTHYASIHSKLQAFFFMSFVHAWQLQIGKHLWDTS